MSRFIIIAAILLLSSYTSQGQSICQYLCNNQTYVSSEDGSTITFYNNGNVAIDGKINTAFSYKLEDCTITLYYKHKEVNILNYSEAGSVNIAHFNGLVDKRNIRYVHLKSGLVIQTGK